MDELQDRISQLHGDASADGDPQPASSEAGEQQVKKNNS